MHKTLELARYLVLVLDLEDFAISFSISLSNFCPREKFEINAAKIAWYWMQFHTGPQLYLVYYAGRAVEQ